MRLWLIKTFAPDVTLLGCPKDYFLAHWRFRMIYGEKSLMWYKGMAEARHQTWVKKGCTFHYRRSFDWRWWKPWKIYIQHTDPK
jgi:hypothetical protein